MHFLGAVGHKESQRGSVFQPLTGPVGETGVQTVKAKLEEIIVKEETKNIFGFVHFLNG